MSVTGILDRIIARKKQATLSAAEQYIAMVRSVAGGAEVDMDDAAQTIDDANKTAADFEKDVSTMQQRIALAEQLKLKSDIEKSIPQLERTAQAARKKFWDAVQTLEPQALLAEQTLRESENRILQLSSAERSLRETCFDETLLAREAQLRAKHKEIGEKLQPLESDHRIAKQVYESNFNAFEDVQKQIERNRKNHPALAKYRTDMERLEPALEASEQTYRDLSSALSALRAELAPIARELEEIDRRKLIP
ncbi:MAG: hypothetical protein ACK56W_19235 [Pirellula sp.]|jgi:chromosome segregation ATPase|nr:hypothetical protein [Pirellula sp.]